MEVVDGCSQYGDGQFDDAIALRCFVVFKKDGCRMNGRVLRGVITRSCSD